MTSFTTHPGALSGTYTPTPLQQVVYGPGSLKQLPDLVRHLLGEGQPAVALIITGQSLQNKTPVVDDVISLLQGAHIEAGAYSGIGQHAPIAGIDSAIDHVQSYGVNILISLGGGSPIDSAKAIAYFVKEKTGSSSFLPHIAIPTTLSAAEFTMNAGYSNEKGDKVGVSSKDIAPKAVILDPEITKYTPQNLWLSSGIRALDHAIESLYRKGSQLPLKHLAIAAIAELFDALPLCKADEKNMEARGRLQIAAWQSLWLNMVPTAIGLSHSLGHKLGATYSIPHGTCSCITLSPSLLLLSRTLPADSWSLAAVSSAVKVIPRAFYPAEAPTDLDSDLRRDAWKIARAVEKLVEQLGVQGKPLREYGVKEEDLLDIATKAVKSLAGWDGVPEADVVVKDVLKVVY